MHNVKNSDVFDILIRMMKALKADSELELAEILGISQSTISTWKIRKKIPEKNILRTSQMSGVPFEWLKTGIGSSKGDVDQRELFRISSRKRGFTLDQHDSLGMFLTSTREQLLYERLAISRAYGKTSREYKQADKTLKAVDTLRNIMDNAINREHPFTEKMDPEPSRYYYRGNRPDHHRPTNEERLKRIEERLGIINQEESNAVPGKSNGTTDNSDR